VLQALTVGLLSAAHRYVHVHVPTQEQAMQQIRVHMSPPIVRFPGLMWECEFDVSATEHPENRLVMKA
jgi:hypothetical protein